MKIMIYGANGFTGRLIIQEVVRQNLDLIIAGRNDNEITELGANFNLDTRIFALSNDHEIRKNLVEVDVLLHCAGPYTITGRPMIDACISTSTHYLDITGELEIFEYCLERSEDARKQEVLLLPGCGFDIIPTENLAGLLYEHLPEANYLELAIYGLGKPSRGTSKSIVKIMADGGQVLEQNQLESVKYGTKTKDFTFMNGKVRTCTIVPLPDLLASRQAFSISNIETYYSMNPTQIKMTRIFRPFMILLKLRPIAGLVRLLIGWFGSDPDEEFREASPSFIYTKLMDENDNSIQGHMKTPNAYDFTAKSTSLILKKLSQEMDIPTGYRSPSEVFGSHLIEEIKGIEWKIVE